jgi:2-oxoglutarate ferredoxin oxidoreductase subunit alpha
VPPRVKAGDGYRIHITGLTHDERGYPVMTPQAQEKLVRRLVDKIRLNADRIVECEEDQVEEAEVIVISYGITSRVSIPAIEMARKQGLKVGHLRLIVVWPFPEKRVQELADHVKAFVVPEINYGQMVLEVERCAAAKAKTFLVPHGGGTVHDPEDIYRMIMKSMHDIEE